MESVKKVLLTVLATGLMALPAVAHSANYQLIRPVDHEQQPRFQQRSAQLTAPYIIGENAVEMNLGSLTEVSPETFLHKTFNLKFSQDKQFDVTFVEAEIQGEFLLVKGKSVDGSWLNTSMTIGDGGYLITFDDHQSGETYRLSGQLASGAGQVTSIDAIMLDEQQRHQHQHGTLRRF